MSLSAGLREAISSVGKGKKRLEMTEIEMSSFLESLLARSFHSYEI